MRWRFGYCRLMLSVLIETKNDEEALARTLASLVSAAVEGVVREVIVCDTGSSDQTSRVAEHAGCRYLAGAGSGDGVHQARSDWLLMLEPGARLLDGWTEAVIDHAGTNESAARFRPARQRDRSFLSGLFARRQPLGAGLLITRLQALSLLRDGQSASAMAGAVKARRLDAEIVSRGAGRRY